MRNNNRIIMLTAAAMLLLTGFTFSVCGQSSEERSVPDFDGLAVAVPGEIYLVQGPTPKLIVEGTDRVLEDLITEVRNGQLTIRLPNRWNFRRNDELTVYVTMPEIKNITMSGSARLFADTPVRADRITITISGSGRVEINDFAANDLTTTISGSGRLKLGGSHNLERSKIVISGSGRAEFENLPAEKVEATISGSGTCSVKAISDLNVRISGSGRVIYTGSPLIDAKITGSGRVVNAN